MKPDCPYSVGQAFLLEHGLSLVLAPNPSPMTYWGTNTYILGQDEIAVIDPGPNDPSHLDALLRAIDGRKVTHILLTHTHLDHSPLAPHLATKTGAPVCAFGDHLAGRSEIMAELSYAGLAGGGEGIDAGFVPDRLIKDGDVIKGTDWELTALHTPGHIANHLSFVWGDAVFTGDHVMGWASSLVSPPDGDLTQFMASCARLKTIPARVYYPGHGEPINDPHERLDWLIAHRNAREAQILAAMTAGQLTSSEITSRIYVDVAASLIPAAQRNVFAHLIDLCAKGVVTALPTLSQDARFELRN